MEAEAFLDVRGNARARVVMVVAHECIEDDGERKGFALGDLRGEDPVAVMAPPELDSFELLVAFAFPGDAQAVAVETALALVANEALMSTRCRVGLWRIGHRVKGMMIPSLEHRVAPWASTAVAVMGCRTSRIVSLFLVHEPAEHAAIPPHGFCTDAQGICLRWCGFREVGCSAHPHVEECSFSVHGVGYSLYLAGAWCIAWKGQRTKDKASEQMEEQGAQKKPKPRQKAGGVVWVCCAYRVTSAACPGSARYSSRGRQLPRWQCRQR